MDSRGSLCIVLLALLSFSQCALGSTSSPSLDFKNFTQKLTHFDPLDDRTFLQRYLITEGSSDVVFLFLAGEAPAEFFEFQEVLPRTFAQEINATYISLEHRYYGKSLPTSDYSTEHMQYLSSEQALADAAHFIASTTKPGLKWIVWGCSYSGGLSAWFRLKYPQLAIGSIAPSGPVQAGSNFEQYYAWFQKVADPKCVSAAQQAVQQIQSALKTANGRAYLKSVFNPCEDFSPNMEDNYYFLLTLTEALGSSDQYDNPPAWPLDNTCNTFTNGTDYLSNWNILINSGSGPKDSCFEFNEDKAFIKPLQDISNQDRSWFWQKCTEFGYFKPTNSSIFFPEHLLLDHQVGWCEKIFGIKNMKPDAVWTNSVYGGYNLDATDVLFTNGIHDPWHLLSINTPLASGVKALTYEAGHCAPMTAPTKDDPPSLVDARESVKSFVRNLIQK